MTGVRREQADDERRLFDRWNTLHLNDADWQAGNLNAFLRQLDRLM